MPTVPNSLKRLAEIKVAIDELRASKLPARIKRMRERFLRQEADPIPIMEIEGKCTRCLETPPLPEARHCRDCTCYYLDLVPQWMRDGLVTEQQGKVWMAELTAILGRNPEDSRGKNEFGPVTD